MNLINQGLKKSLIKFNDEQTSITYLHQNKQRNYNNPEEKVQAETFLKLVLIYGYSPDKILQFVPVTMGSTTKEADIIVYNDEEKESPHILVECKKQDVSELEFKQAIEQGFSYAVAEGAKYVWVTSGIKDEYFEVPKEKPKARISIPDIPQFGVTKLAKFKYAKNGGEVNGQRLFELEIVTEDDLTRRFKQAHNALWGGGELNPSSAFDELDKLIFCKIWDEKKPRKQGEAYDFQIFREDTEEKTNTELIKRIKSLYDEGRKKDPEVFKDDIRLSAEKLRTVVGYLEGINLGDTDLDSKGRAFETFMGSFFRGDFGQYFTPRNIVKFIVEVLPITNNSLVLDTSCGSGGFLLHVLDKIRQQAKEYYAENSIEHYKYWHDFAEKNLFGIEINEQIARTAKMNMIIHDDGHTNVISADGLLPSEEIRIKTNNQGFANNRFDFIITNPPFGSTVKQTEQAYMNNYDFAWKEIDWLNPKSMRKERENQNTEILFIEQCYLYLKEGGYLAIVVPDGILTNSSLQYVRDWIEEKFRIVGVISLPQTAFQATGAGVKSSILFLKKHDFTTTKKIQEQKLNLQDDLKSKINYFDLLKQLEKEKKEKIKNLDGFENVEGLEGKALQNSDLFKEWKTEVNNEFRERIDEIKANLLDEYLSSKQELLPDYAIFMAIAEDIGYDATGKETNHNELDFIGEELKRFIEAIERGEDSFFLSDNVDHNKIFLVSIGNTYERLDPNYVKYFSSFKNVLHKCKYPLHSFRKYINNIQYGISSLANTEKKGLPILRMNNLQDDEWNFADLKYIQLTKKETNLYKLKKGDLLFNRTNSKELVGKCAVFNENTDYVFASYLIRVQIDQKGLLSKFASIFLQLSIGRLQIDSISRQIIGMTNINAEEIKNLLIPIPPLEIQNQIVTKMDNAYTSKKEKEAEAQRLLDSIDDYLLGELGIELPQPEENNINNRIFCRRLSDISGGRFDAPAHHKKFSLETKFYRMEKLSNWVFINPLTRFTGYKLDDKATFIPMEYISEIYGEAETSQIRNIQESEGYTKFLENDLIWAKITPCMENGKSAVVTNLINNIGFGSTEYHVFRAKKNINIKYIHALLRLKSLRSYAKLYFSGSVGHQRVSDQFFKQLLIPIPPIEKQNEIAENITKIREKAKQLQEEAKRELEETKIEVEKMILGE